MANDLSGLSILITRPEPQALSLSKMIVDAGGRAIKFATIAFQSPDDTKQFLDDIKHLGAQDWLIFVSPQAVYSAVPEIRRAWPDFPSTVKFAAVGKGTARALQEAGYNPEVYPAKEGGAGLLELPAFQSPQGLRIAIIRGEGGRELIDPELSARGATVLTLIAYKRVLPEVDATPIEKLLAEGAIHVIICTSFEGVKNLKILLAQQWGVLKKIPLCVASDRIKRLAKNLGFETIWVPHEMSNTAIVQLLMEKRNDL
jgi:uroporphyrinogen-III synthase